MTTDKFYIAGKIELISISFNNNNVNHKLLLEKGNVDNVCMCDYLLIIEENCNFFIIFSFTSLLTGRWLEFVS